MLELYHHGSSVCAAKVRLVLGEKNLEWTGHYIDILKGDQFDPDYLKLNKKAVVPTLVHDGRVVVESTVICEYLDDVFPDPSLKPSDPFDKAQMRLWTKAVDEAVHPACADLTFVSCHRYIIQRLGPEGVKEFLYSTPPQSVITDWHRRKRELVELGFEAPGIGRKVALYDQYLSQMEDTLREQPWLAGTQFSLADIALTPYVNRVDMLGMSGLWKNGKRPHLEDWWGRIKERPTFKPALLDWCPEQLTNDLMTYGTQSWPKVQSALNLPA